MGVSIIICSRSKESLNFVVETIGKTADVDYEILSSLHASNFGLSTIYNELASTAKYEYLIFMHDDICFDSFSWGSKIIKILSDQKIGLVGLMGATYKSASTSLWTSCDSSLFRISLSTDLNTYSEVVTLDGCFLALRKEVFTYYHFDENLKGFHGYDLDICLQVFSKLKIVVANNILFKHLSNGNKNEKWFCDYSYIHNKWKSILPVSVGQITSNEKRHSDYLSLSDQFNSTRLFYKNKKHLIVIYFKLLFKYFRFNKLRHTKQLMRSFYR